MQAYEEYYLVFHPSLSEYTLTDARHSPLLALPSSTQSSKTLQSRSKNKAVHASPRNVFGRKGRSFFSKYWLKSSSFAETPEFWNLEFQQGAFLQTI